MNYSDFLTRKSQLGGQYGFDPIELHDAMFPFQTDLVTWALQKGRAAIFADCGLGKTLMELVFATNIVRATNKPAIIVAPLAVAYQSMREAQKFGIEASVSRDGSIQGDITITNYEKLHLFKPADFCGMICDESGILKNFDGMLRNSIVEFMRALPYRLLCSATPSPNDYFELGNSSEALGELSFVEMLSRFFIRVQNEKKKSDKPTTDIWEGKQWRFRGHSEMPFWQWVCSWARAIRRPSDLGYADDGFILPSLIETDHIIDSKNTAAEGFLIPLPAIGLDEQRKVRKRTIQDRCEALASIAEARTDQSLLWCHLNPEGDLLEQILHGRGVQISGKDSDDTKEKKFLDFINGDTKILITKPKIGAWGLNLQNCHHIGQFTTHSYEAYYQGICRCLRYGQAYPVEVDTVMTEGDKVVMENLKRKAIAASRMFEHLVQQMTQVITEQYGGKKMEMPKWM